MATPNNPILRHWENLRGLPFGATLFSIGVGRMARYTGSIGARVRELRPGFARVEMRDRSRVRNHLSSVHAVALLNLAEVTSGLAMLCGLPEDARGIVTGLSIRYHKKARGLLTATCTCEPPDAREEREIEIEAEIRDPEGDVVATATACWRVGPKS